MRMLTSLPFQVWGSRTVVGRMACVQAISSTIAKRFPCLAGCTSWGTYGTWDPEEDGMFIQAKADARVEEASCTDIQKTGVGSQQTTEKASLGQKHRLSQAHVADLCHTS